VSAIIGTEPYEFITRDYGIPCVVAGFEPLDILQGIDMLLEQIENGQARVTNEYSRTVQTAGNPIAREMVERVFEPADADWRGIGTLPGSGLKLRAEYQRFDAERAFQIEPGPTKEHAGCRCGDILRGAMRPPQCKLFGKVCNPEHPVGPCMVSSEGTCSTWFQYGSLRPDTLE
jgi:hydrogenase expression/formation protein HypD